MRSTSSHDITGEHEAEIMRDYIEWIDYIHEKEMDEAEATEDTGNSFVVLCDILCDVLCDVL